MRKSTKRVIGITAAAVVLLGVSGIAYAYWTAGGSGTGTAETADNVPITVVQESVITGLQPEGAPQTLAGSFNNTNESPVYVTSVTASIASVTVVGTPPGTCDATDYTLANPTMIVGAEVPVGTAVGDWTGATIQFNNKATNQDACKGATVNLSYEIS